MHIFKIFAVMAVMIFSAFNASADLFPKAYKCSTEPFVVQGQTITVKMDLNTGWRNSVKSFRYSYNTPRGTFEKHSKEMNCTSVDALTSVCYSKDSRDLVSKVNTHPVFGVAVTSVDSPSARFLNCK